MSHKNFTPLWQLSHEGNFDAFTNNEMCKQALQLCFKFEGLDQCCPGRFKKLTSTVLCGVIWYCQQHQFYKQINGGNWTRLQYMKVLCSIPWYGPMGMVRTLLSVRKWRIYVTELLKPSDKMYKLHLKVTQSTTIWAMNVTKSYLHNQDTETLVRVIHYKFTICHSLGILSVSRQG